MSLPEIKVGDVWVNPTGEEHKVLCDSSIHGEPSARVEVHGREMEVNWLKFTARATRKGDKPPKPKLDIGEGSVVQLKSGGFFMTVVVVRNDTVWTTWMNDEGKIGQGSFPIALLKLVENA